MNPHDGATYQYFADAAIIIAGIAFTMFLAWASGRDENESEGH